jgi:hypothetical protein
MTLLSVEQRISRLEAAEEIRTLKARYCDFCDRGYDPDGLAALFTDTAVWSGGLFGRYEGKEAIREFFRSISGSLVFAAHLVMNPIIEVVDDNKATGKWRSFEPATVNENGKLDSKILLSAYNDIYVREAGKWLHQSVDLHVNFFEPLSKGWSHSAVQ